MPLPLYVADMKRATVTTTDGRIFYGRVGQSHLETQIHHEPHDPDIESPLWLANSDVASVVWDDE